MRPRVLLLLGCFLMVARGSRLIGRHTLQLCDPGYYWYYNISNDQYGCNECTPDVPECSKLFIDVNMSLDARINLNQSLLPTNIKLEKILESNEIDLEIDDCPPGYYCNDDWPTPCPSGTYNPTYRASSLFDCLDCPLHHFCPLAAQYPWSCPDGYYTDQIKARDASDCGDCPAGYYCPRNIPIACPNGTYQPLTGALTIYECIMCPPAQYCSLASISPTYCPAGTYNEQEGSSDIRECLPCFKNAYCPLGSSMPIPCPLGYYRNTTGGASYKDCIKQIVCPMGDYLYQDISCLSCTMGSFCVNNSRVACGVGYFSNTTSSTMCQTCAAGTFSPNTGQYMCPQCPSGYYCNGGKIQKCANYTTTSPGAVSDSECTCEAGYTCSFIKEVIVSLVLQFETGTIEEFTENAKRLVITLFGITDNNIQLVSVLTQ